MLTLNISHKQHLINIFTTSSQLSAISYYNLSDKMKALNILCILFLFIFPSPEAKWTKFDLVCPDCIVDLKDVYKTAKYNYRATITLPDCVCRSGVKMIFFGADYGMPNVCCCFKSKKPDLIDCGADSASAQCPMGLVAGTDEPIELYNKRVGQFLEGAPANGCCPNGTVKWIFEKERTGANGNICACLVKK